MLTSDENYGPWERKEELHVFAKVSHATIVSRAIEESLFSVVARETTTRSGLYLELKRGAWCNNQQRYQLILACMYA